MEAILETIIGFLGTLVASNTVSVPIFLIIIGLILGMKLGKAIRSGLITAVALTGLWTILGLFMNAIGPAAVAIGTRLGSSARFDLPDVGWMPRQAAGFNPISLSFVGVGILLNLALVMLGLVKTISIEFLGPILANGTMGLAVYLITGNWWLGLLASTIIFVISWKLADWQQPMVEKFFGYKNISLIVVGVNEVGLLAWPIAWILDKIPGLKEGKFTADWVNEKFGVFGEPMFIGFTLGIVLGIAGGYTFIDTLNLAVILAASLNIMPRMIGILMEGLVPIQDALRNFLKKYAGKRQIYIGMDVALGTGHPAVLATATIMVPFTLLIAFFMPGNRILPMADLGVLVFTLLYVVVMNKGDIVRSVITSLIVMVVVLWLANADAPILTLILRDQNLIEATAKAGQLTAGGTPYSWLYYNILKLLGYTVPGV